MTLKKGCAKRGYTIGAFLKSEEPSQRLQPAQSFNGMPRARPCVIAKEGQGSMSPKLTNLLKHNSFAFAVGFLVIGVVVASIGVITWFNAPDFRSNGDVVQAEVTRVWEKELGTSRSSERQIQYLVAYNIALPSGSAIAGAGEVTKEAFDRLRPGDQILVEVLIEDPMINRPVDTPDPYGSTIIFIFAGLFCAGLGALLAKNSYRAANALVRLHNHGIATTARVQELKRTQIRQGRSAIKIGGQPGEGDPFLYQLIYKYEGPDGQSYSGESQPYSAVFFAGANPQKNDLIDIIVDPDTPSSSAWCQDFYGFNDKN